MQYFAAVQPQRRLAPHIHIAMRGTVSRAELHRVLAATDHQVWWPDTSAVQFDGEARPVWDEHGCTYVDPCTGEVLPTWDNALDAIAAEDEPVRVARFGDRFDAQGVLSGSKDAARCIGYLTKQVADCHQAQSDAERAHADRLAEALWFEPCSPRCADWLRYGIRPARGSGPYARGWAAASSMLVSRRLRRRCAAGRVRGPDDVPARGDGYCRSLNE